MLMSNCKPNCYIVQLGLQEEVAAENIFCIDTLVPIAPADDISIVCGNQKPHRMY